ncbi:LacI family DNA-binding transcriptional regulator [Mucisphaera sp.]|uniref:LacI family DNA-binding transcriptional regulator n=1 Tax=Mucisphaera sp. TaxID=2913024 RepID=UPI003D123513
MATVRDIASSLGVSPATVSRSLNNAPEVSEHLRRKVIDEAKRMGYVASRRRPRTGTIGMMFVNETSGPMFSGYDATIWSGVARAAAASGYAVSVFDPRQRREGEGFEALAARLHLDGLLIRNDWQTRELAQEIADTDLPTVVVADRFDHGHANYVCCNSAAPSRQAIEHLLHLGHERIALCHHVLIDTDHRDRIDAYHDALRDAGIQPDPQLQIGIRADVEGGSAALSRFLSLPDPPTAIFFTDPPATVGALRRAVELGLRVPEDLSIIGVDDEDLRRMTHPVYTAVCQDAAEIGYQAARWLCRSLAGTASATEPDARLNLELEAFLEINKTTAAPPSRALRMSPNGHRIDAAS